MDRRTFLASVTGGLLAAPLAAKAQGERTVPKIGVINFNAPVHAPRFESAFWGRMRELGWVEGQSLAVELRGAGGDWGRLPSLAAELVQRKVNVIVMDNGTAARRVQEGDRTVPICVAGGDLQAAGVVANLAKPEGNVTGVQLFQASLAGKRLALLKEAVPGLTRVGILFERRGGLNDAVLRATEDAARTMGLKLYVVEAPAPDDFNRAFSALTKVGAPALLVVNNANTVIHQNQVLGLAAKSRLAALYEYRDWTEAGGLMSYGPVISEMWRQLAECADKILKGAKPADVPVQQPSKFDLVINLKTAKALGLTIPQALLQRADQVIE